MINNEIRQFYKGVRHGITRFAWWKDGTQYVGTCGTTLGSALDAVSQDEQRELGTHPDNGRVGEGLTEELRHRLNEVIAQWHVLPTEPSLLDACMKVAQFAYLEGRVSMRDDIARELRNQGQEHWGRVVQRVALNIPGGT